MQLIACTRKSYTYTCLESWTHPSSHPKQQLDQFNGSLLFPSKLPLPMGIWTPSNVWFLGPSEFTYQKTFKSIQQFLKGSRLWQTDRQTDRLTDRPRYFVCITRPHLCSTALRPKKLKCDINTKPSLSKLMVSSSRPTHCYWCGWLS